MIRIKQGPEPFSPASLSLDPASEPILIESNVERLLRQELIRYCDCQVDGRSFLIAGHRGAGKTTTVLNALLHVWRLKEENKLKLRPLPVVLHGPALFPPVKEVKPVEQPPAPLKFPPLVGNKSTPTRQDAEPAQAAGATANNKETKQTVVANASGDGAADAQTGADPPARNVPADLLEAENALIQIILGLHRSVTREFVFGYWKQTMKAPVANRLSGLHWGVQPAELAAQFEAELIECPPPVRLREFWDLVDATATGVLFDTVPAPELQVPRELRNLLAASIEAGTPAHREQGSRELVALDGIVRAYRRLSGKFSQTDLEKTNAARERTAKTDLNISESIKPFVSLATGALFAGGVAIATGSPFKTFIAGVVSALAAGAVFKYSSSRTQKVEYSREERWIPNREANTLDRVLPTIIDRLRCAGLAPVFIVDELDKVEGLSTRLRSMVHHLKKLVAENAVFCFLADRSYFEDLHLRSDKKTYGVDYSYYSFRRLVCFRPEDMDAYLIRSLEAVVTDSGALSEKTLASDKLDLPVLRLVLRHRAEMHALSLKRELAAVRGDNDEVQILSGDVRSRRIFRIDLTFQVAIERSLALENVSEWLAQNPEKVQTLYDALYFLSRKWRSDQYAFNLSEAEKPVFALELERRMNLDEAREVKPREKKGGEPAPNVEPALSGQDVEFLFATVKGLATALCSTHKPSDQPLHPSKATSEARREAGLAIDPAVADALLQGDDSLLKLADSEQLRYEFQYSRSGDKRQIELKPPEAKGTKRVTGRKVKVTAAAGPAAPGRVLGQEDRERIAAIVGFEKSIWKVWKTPSDPADPAGRLFAALAEQFRVIPTTPAPSTVQRAIERLVNLPIGASADPIIAADLACLEEFRTVLGASAKTVLRVLALASFFGRVRGSGPVPTLVRRGLDTLARGLRFAERDIRSMEEATDALIERFKSFKDLSGLPSLLSVLSSSELDTPNVERQDLIETTLDVCIAAVTTLAANTLDAEQHWKKTRQDAWTECEHRLIAFVKNGMQTDIELNEFLCLARETGPSLLITPSLRQMNLIKWTTTLVCAMKGQTPSDPTATATATEPVPRWLAVIALVSLGLRVSSAGVTTTIAMQLSVGANPTDAERTHLLIQDEGLLVGQESSRGTLIFVRRKQSTLSQDWNDGVPGYLSLTPTHDEAMEMVGLTRKATTALLDIVPRPLVVAWEQEPDSLKNEGEIVKQINIFSSPDRPNIQLWVYRNKPERPKVPFVIAPRSMKDVIDAASRTSTSEPPTK